MSKTLTFEDMKRPVEVARFDALAEREPAYALVRETDLVVIRLDERSVSVLYGRCLHRGALLSDGYLSGRNLICGVHGWDYRADTGVSEYNNEEALRKFPAVVRDGRVYVDEADIETFESEHPQGFDREAYQGLYADTHPEATEPHVGRIRSLARSGLGAGPHGPVVSMGVDRGTLPRWDSFQFLPAQLARKPLPDDADVVTETVIGPNARKPLTLSMPIFVTDMSFGALSREAKIALARGAERAGTGIASGEGGMLPEEQAENSRYFHEFASGEFGFSWEKVRRVQAFHFKVGQGAKSGVGGHLPGEKVTEEIARVRGLAPGEDAVSPPTFRNLSSVKDFREMAERVREKTGGIPVGFKMAAGHIEEDIDFALEAGADYIILDGRGGGTGATPEIIRDHSNVPTIPALARARRHLESRKADGVTLIITGGLRVPEDFAKALMLGADAVAIGNAAIQAIGCLGMRACSSNFCPVGVATQKDDLRTRIKIETSAAQLARFLAASTDLMKVIARANGYGDFRDFNSDDLSTFDRDTHFLSGVRYAGILPPKE